MIAVKDLTQNEIYDLIHTIPIEFVLPALKDSRVFNRLFPGSTIKKLTEKKLHNSLRMNYKDSVVQSILKKYLADMGFVVDKRKKELMDKGFEENSSFIMALSEEIIPSVFPVYLKYYEIQYDQNFLTALNCYKKATNRCKELQKEIDEQKASVLNTNELKDNITSLEDKNIVLQEENNSLLVALEQARSELDNKQNEIREIKSKFAFAEGAIVSAEKPYESNDQVFINSSFGVIKDFGDDIKLKRLIDIEGNVLSEIDSEDNRFKWLYLKNGPKQSGLYGVWNWYITQNRKDPTSEIALTDYNHRCQPITIQRYNNVLSVEDLLIKLKEGLEAVPKTHRIMFAVPAEENSYAAILCDDSEYTFANGVIKLKDTVIHVKKYIIDQNDIVDLGNEGLFYRYISMPISGIYVLVDTALEIVKKIVIDQATWTVAKRNGIERKDWQSFRNMVKAITTDDIYSEIMEKCLCSKEEADRLITELKENAEHLLSGDDISSKTLIDIINNNTELLARCKSLVEDKWRTENQGLIKEGQDKIADLAKECDAKQKDIEELEINLKTIQTEIKKYQDSITEKEKLATAVEEKVNQRIEEARKNAADFIAEMAFVSSVQVNNGVSLNNTVNAITERNLPYDIEEIKYGSTEALIDDVLYDNMLDAGIERDSAKVFSAYLCSAHLQKIPIFLAGPNSEEIINAYSAAVCGCLAAIFDCEIPYSSDALQQLYNNNSEIICVKNILNSRWITHIPELLRSKSHIVFVCPFAEDLIIEPKGMYNYAVPIVTDLFVNEKAMNIAYIGKADKSYNSIDLDDDKYERQFNAVKNRVNKKTHARALFVNNLSNLIKGVYAICGETEADIAESLCGYVPYLFVCQETEKLIELIDNDSNIPSEKQKEIKNFIGAENE